MRFRLVIRRAPRPQDLRLDRLIRVLLAARKARQYREVLESIGLASEESIRAVGSAGSVLGRFPPSVRRPVASRLRRPRSRPFLESPRGCESRTALFHANLRPSGDSRLFSPEDFHSVPRFRPQAVAAPAWLLIDFARAIEAGQAPALRLTHYTLAFTGVPDGVLLDSDRDLLWRMFQVPVFEQFLGFDGSVVAAECEAHEGLHVHTDRAIVEFAFGEILLTSLVDLETPAIRVRTGLTADVLLSRCGCGAPGVRLGRLRPIARAAKRHWQAA